MKDLNDEKKIAVLIDADNAQPTRIPLILREVSTHGHVITKRAYGDWSSTQLKSWRTQLNEWAIQPIQQFAYTKGKNSTDAALIIDAMDLLYTQKYDAFVLVSSDSDFTRLAARLRESQMYVIGVGEAKTPVSFRNACDEFLIVENLDEAPAKPKAKAPPRQSLLKSAEAERSDPPKEELPAELVGLLRKAYEKYSEDGWANVAPTGNFVMRLKPDFDPRTYGFKKLPDLIASIPEEFEMTKFPGKGGNIVAFRPVESDS